MPRQTHFRPSKTPQGWRINIPARYAQGGRRERHFYPTKEEADRAAAKLRESRAAFGEQRIGISPALAAEAVAAQRVLHGSGLALLEAARQAAGAVALLRDYGITPLEAAERVAAGERALAASCELAEACRAFRLAKEDRSEIQQRLYSYMARDLEAAFGGRPLASITGAELAGHLADVAGSAGAHNQRLKLLRAFWRWCGRPPRAWCNPELPQHLEPRPEVHGEVGVLDAGQARRLLRAAEKHFPDCVPGFAIGLFCGVRQAELARLRAQDVTAEGITVPATSAKTGRRRFIEMPAPLAAWLRAWPITGQAVLPPNWPRRERAVRRLAGWKVWSDLVEPNKPPADAPEWPRNALRHTAATARLALGQPIERLVFEHGHSGGLTTLRNHYLGKMTRRQAVELWRLGPKGRKLKHLTAA